MTKDASEIQQQQKAAELQEKEDQIQKINQQYQTLKQDNEVTSKNIEKLAEKMEELVQDKKLLGEKILQLSKMNENQVKIIQDSKNIILNKDKEIKKLKKRKNKNQPDLNPEISQELELTNQHLQMENDALRESLHSMSQIMNNKLIQIEFLQSSISELQSKNQNDLEVNEEQINNLNINVSEIKEKSVEDTNLLADATKNIHNKDKEIEELKSRLAEAEEVQELAQIPEETNNVIERVISLEEETEKEPEIIESNTINLKGLEKMIKVI